MHSEHARYKQIMEKCETKKKDYISCLHTHYDNSELCSHHKIIFASCAEKVCSNLKKRVFDEIQFHN